MSNKMTTSKYAADLTCRCWDSDLKQYVSEENWENG